MKSLPELYLEEFWNRASKIEFNKKAYEYLNIELSIIYQKVTELRKSRDTWKEKYEKLKNTK